MMKDHQKFLRALEKCPLGSLDIITPEGEKLKFQGDKPGPHAHLEIKNWAMIDLLSRRGDIGFGEAYVLGFWESSDVAECIAYGALNMAYLKEYAVSTRWRQLGFYLYNNFVRLNSKRGSKINIRQHYDIGNDFYQHWLDPSMTYSSALCLSPEDDLAQAQQNKYQRILDIAKPDQARILEIGCGWGGFAEQASVAGAKVTGITVSSRQYQFAHQRLGDKATIMLEDYRNIRQVFDYVVSIEMFEAVGERYWPQYFRKIKDSLYKGGRALIQTITIQDHLFKSYRQESDYIRHYIFPGGILPSKQRFVEEAQKAGFLVKSLLEFGKDYAWTLRQWLKNFKAARPRIKNMGYEEPFLRSWEFYLHMALAGFKVGRTDVIQVELERV
ncbi:MAG: class I SAM-dependent methyltransferase [Rhodospirillaceae bacterium]|nr:class I SAM-dependent methyltransferase [Rhodospirillaceae bacterium]